MASLHRLASDTRRYVRNAMFGNHHSVETNIRYASYQRMCQKHWKPTRQQTDVERAASERFTHNGFEVLPPPAGMSAQALLELKNKVDGILDQPDSRVEISDGLFRMVDGSDRVPEIINFVDPELESVIEGYYRSHFKIFGIYFYRTIPTPSKPESSFLWHIDNCPRQEIKLMIYLDDVQVDTGAIRLKDKPLTDQLKSSGFRDRKSIDAFADILANEATTNAIVAPVGTRILFQNGGVIHRAISPERQHRDVVTFVIIPSDIPWRPHYARTRHLLGTNAGICIDPYSDRPEHVGYRY
jgi:hypothetical protein